MTLSLIINENKYSYYNLWIVMRICRKMPLSPLLFTVIPRPRSPGLSMWILDGDGRARRYGTSSGLGRVERQKMSMSMSITGNGWPVLMVDSHVRSKYYVVGISDHQEHRPAADQYPGRRLSYVA
jgi:hypothetical protein